MVSCSVRRPRSAQGVHASLTVYHVGCKSVPCLHPSFFIGLVFVRGHMTPQGLLQLTWGRSCWTVYVETAVLYAPYLGKIPLPPRLKAWKGSLDAHICLASSPFQPRGGSADEAMDNLLLSLALSNDKLENLAKQVRGFCMPLGKPCSLQEWKRKNHVGCENTPPYTLAINVFVNTASVLGSTAVQPPSFNSCRGGFISYSEDFEKEKDHVPQRQRELP
eukprot:1159208-Pelagomonas_calceolata.AAC.13